MSLKYEVFFGDTISELENTINALIEEGWYPHGGVALSFRPCGEAGYAQAMLLAGEDDEDDECEEEEEEEEEECEEESDE